MPIRLIEGNPLRAAEQPKLRCNRQRRRGGRIFCEFHGHAYSQGYKHALG